MRRRDPAADCRGTSAPASASVRTPGRRPRPLRLRGLRVHVLRGLGPADRRDPGPAGRARGAGRWSVRGGEDVPAALGPGSPTMPGVADTPRPVAPGRSGRHRPRGGSDRWHPAVRCVGVVVRVIADRVAGRAAAGTGCGAVVRQVAQGPDCVSDLREQRADPEVRVPDSAAAGRAVADHRGGACSADLARSSDQMYATPCAGASFTGCTVAGSSPTWCGFSVHPREMVMQ